MGASRGWIEEAGRAQLGFDDPAPYAHLDPEARRGVTRRLRAVAVGVVTAAVVAVPIAWVVTADPGGRATAVITALFVTTFVVWTVRSELRDIRDQDEADERRSWAPPAPSVDPNGS